MSNPQILIRDRILDIAKDYLAWARIEEGTGHYYDLACWCGERRGQSIVTWGLTANIGSSQLDPGKYNPMQWRNVWSLKVAIDLYLPEDARGHEQDQEIIEDSGNSLPRIIESMNDQHQDLSGREERDIRQMIICSIRNLDEVQNISGMLMDRGVYGNINGNSLVLERLGLNIKCNPEACWDFTAI